MRQKPIQKRTSPAGQGSVARGVSGRRSGAMRSSLLSLLWGTGPHRHLDHFQSALATVASTKGSSKRRAGSSYHWSRWCHSGATDSVFSENTGYSPAQPDDLSDNGPRARGAGYEPSAADGRQPAIRGPGGHPRRCRVISIGYTRDPDGRPVEALLKGQSVNWSHTV